MNIYELIKKMQADKRIKHIMPDHIMFLELQKEIMDRLRNELNDLYRKGKIEIIETINDKAVKAK